MRRDSKAFKERFKAWKNGQLVYENGRPIELPGYEGGKDGKIKEEDRFATTEMPELVVTAPRKYVQEYDQNGNPVYTTDYTKSMAYEGVRPSESKYQRWANRDKNASTYTDPIIKAAQIGIGAPLAVTTAPATIGSLFKAAGPLLTRPLTTVTEAASEYLPAFSRTLPYTEMFDRGLMGYMGARGVYDAGKGWYNGEMPWYQAISQMGLSGLMMSDAAPLVSRGYNNIKLFNLTRKPNVPEEFSVFKPQARTRVGDVEIDNPNLLYHLDRGDRAGAFSNQGAYVEDGVLFPGTPKESSNAPYSWWNKGRPFSTAVNGQPMTRLMTTTEDIPGMLHVKSQNYPIGQWDGKRGFVRNSEYVNPEGVNVSGSTYTLDPGYGWRRVFIEETPTLNWADAIKTPKTLMSTSVGYSSPIDTKYFFTNARRKYYQQMVSGSYKVNPLDFESGFMKNSPLSFISRDHIGVEFPVPDQAKKILENSTLPRMLVMRPWMNQQQLNERLSRLIDTKYTEFPEEAFKIANPEGHKFSGSYNQKTDFINMMRGEDPMWVMPHEVRHRVDYFEPLVEAEENYLENAYGQIFKDIPNNYPELAGYKHMPDEMVTTNQDARTALLGKYSAANVDWSLQNKIIDKKSDLDIINAVRNANGYGRRFIETLENLLQITPERIQAIREAMKNVGMLSVPITVGSSMLPTNNEIYNGFKNGKDSGIHIKPSHRGKFTALKKRTGHSASWFKAHGTPAQKKMATFDLNSRKWKH